MCARTCVYVVLQCGVCLWRVVGCVKCGVFGHIYAGGRVKEEGIFLVTLTLEILPKSKLFGKLSNL